MHMEGNLFSSEKEQKLECFEEIFCALDGFCDYLGINGQYKEDIECCYKSICRKIRKGEDYNSAKDWLAFSAYDAIVPKFHDTREVCPSKETLRKTRAALDIKRYITNEMPGELRRLIEKCQRN